MIRRAFAALLLLCACATAQAQDRIDTLSCSWDETGAMALQVVVKDWRTLDRVTYFRNGETKDAIEVLEFYDGGIVKALFARYSPALTFRLEVYRDKSRDGRVYIGQMWPIASSGAFPVTCREVVS
ncbi:MAG: hypothetical protein AB8B82_02585 [Roseovarius sp.]